MYGFQQPILHIGKTLSGNSSLRLPSRIHYAIRAGHHKGHGIHSPYLYHLITNVLYNKFPYYCFEQLESLLRSLPENLMIKTQGPDKQLLSANSNHIRTCHTLFRLAHDAKAEYMVETGFCGDPDSAYLAHVTSSAHCLCLSCNNDFTAYGKAFFKTLNVPNVECLTCNQVLHLQQALAKLPHLDFAVFNSNMDTQFQLDCFQACLEKKHQHSIFVMKQIHSKNMDKVWNTVKNNPEVSVSLDLFSIGILLFRPDLQKRKYILRK